MGAAAVPIQHNVAWTEALPSSILIHQTVLPLPQYTNNTHRTDRRMVQLHRVDRYF